jgi:hypothetical protein
VRRSLFAACLAATVVICADAAPAGADTTLRGRILGQPQLSGAHARVPLLLANGTAVVLTVPARSGFRTATTGRTTADGTRLGDAVSAEVGAVRAGRASATYLKIVTRSPAPTFDDLRAQLGAASTGAKEAVDAVGRIGAAQAGGPQDPAALRFTLLGLRAQLNTLIASLRDQADNMSKVATSIKDRPRARAHPAAGRHGRRRAVGGDQAGEGRHRPRRVHQLDRRRRGRPAARRRRRHGDPGAQHGVAGPRRAPSAGRPRAAGPARRRAAARRARGAARVGRAARARVGSGAP